MMRAAEAISPATLMAAVPMPTLLRLLVCHRGLLVCAIVTPAADRIDPEGVDGKGGRRTSRTRTSEHTYGGAPTVVRSSGDMSTTSIDN